MSGFILLNEAVAEVGAQGESVVAIEAREGELLLLAELPVVGRDQDDRVRAVELAIVNGIVGNGNVDRDQPRDIREAIVADAQQCQLMVAQIELTKAIELVLLAVLQPLQEAVAAVGLTRERVRQLCDSEYRERAMERRKKARQ